MEVDPNIPICQILGEKIPDNDLTSYEIEKISQDIATDPLWPKNYIRRAIAYMSIDQYKKAESDLEQFAALAMNDEHLDYEMFWWLRQCYKNQLYKQAEFLIPYAEKLMTRFPADVPSHRDMIEEIVKINTENGRIELAELWKTKLQKLDNKDR